MYFFNFYFLLLNLDGVAFGPGYHSNLFVRHLLKFVSSILVIKITKMGAQKGFSLLSQTQYITLLVLK